MGHVNPFFCFVFFGYLFILIFVYLKFQATKERLLIASFGLTISNRMVCLNNFTNVFIVVIAIFTLLTKKTFKPEENVEELLKKLEYFSYIENRIKSACDSSYLYWHFKVLVPIYLTDIYENASTPNKIHVRLLLI